MSPSDLIDEYFQSVTPAVAQLCAELRALIHEAEPGIKEEWKWGPNFQYNGKMICGLGAFKAHAHLAFFQGALMKDNYKLFNNGFDNEHNRGIKLKPGEKFNKKHILAYIKEAVKISLKNVSPAKEKPKKDIATPADIRKALSKAGLLKGFEAMTYYHRKEYIEWIEDAKKLETRVKRIEKMVIMLKEGKGLNDKYRTSR